MLYAFRQAFRGRAFQIFIWATAIMLSLGVGLPYLFSPDTGNWVATVNAQSIDVEDFGRAVKQEQMRIAQWRRQLGEHADLLLGGYNPYNLALERLINEAILSQVVTRIGLDLSKDFVVKQIVKLLPPEVFDATGKIDQALLERVVPHYRTIRAFEMAVEQSLERDLVLKLVQHAQYIPRFMAKQRFANEHLKKKYSVLVLPKRHFIDQEKPQSYTTQQLRAFYDEQNRLYNKYVRPARRIGVAWEFYPKSYGIKIGDQALKQYYTKHKRAQFLEKSTQYTVRRIQFSVAQNDDPRSVHQQARAVLKQLKEDPTAFERLAREHSDHKETAQKGGLFTFEKGSVLREIEQTVIRLKTAQEISDIIKTSEGFEIIQRIKRIPAQFKPFDQVKDEIEQKLVDKEFKRSFAAQAKQVTAGSDTEAIETFAADKKARKTPVAYDKGSASQAGQMLFKLKKGKFGYFFDKGNHGYIVQLTDIQPAHTPELSEIERQVRTEMQQDRASKALETAIGAAEAELSTKSLDQLKQTYSGRLIATDWVKRGDLEADESMKRENVPVAQLIALEKPGATASAVTAHGGYLMRLDAIEPFDAGQFGELEATITQELERENQSVYQSGFIASLRRNATIKRNKKLIRQGLQQ